MRQTSPLVKAVLVALIVGLAVYLGARQFFKPPAEIQALVKVPPPSVLVAAKAISRGHRVSSADLEWKQLSEAEHNNFNGAQFISDRDRPAAISQFSGFLSKENFPKGMRITNNAFQDPSNRLSARLRPGMRAVSVKIDPQNSVGGLILPNDYVDVNVIESWTIDNTRQVDGNIYQEPPQFHSRGWTVLTNIRVLAIDQRVEQNGDDVAIVGSTATLEIPADQTVMFNRVTMQGSSRGRNFSLALRGMLDPDGTPAESPGVNTAFEHSQLKDVGVKLVGFGRSVSKPIDSQYGINPSSENALPTDAAMRPIDGTTPPTQEEAALPAPVLMGDTQTNLDQRALPNTSLALPGFEIDNRQSNQETRGRIANQPSAQDAVLPQMNGRVSAQ